MERLAVNDLEAVLAIARRGSFRAAAVDLGMSTTALSHAIGRLEGNLGVRLFNRTTRSVAVTEAGRLFVDQLDDEPAQLGRVLNLVLRLGENLPEDARLAAQHQQRLDVLHLQLGAAFALQALPVAGSGNADIAAIGWLAIFVGHLQEDQVGQLLQIVAVADPIVAQGGTETPNLGDDGMGSAAHNLTVLLIQMRLPGGRQAILL